MTLNLSTTSVPSFLILLRYNRTMENERVYILIFSYLIGFVTAYIAFGVAVTPDNTQTAVVLTAADQAARDIPTAAESAPPAGPPSLSERADGLYVMVGGEERIISGQSLTDTAADGFHTKIISAAISPNEEFVVYCAQTATTAALCQPFVYDIAANVIYRVTVGDTNQQLSVSISDADINWLDDRLVIADYLSLDGEVPWRVSTLQQGD